MGLFDFLFSSNNSSTSSNHTKTLVRVWVQASWGDWEGCQDVEEYRLYLQRKLNFYGEIDIRHGLEWWNYGMDLYRDYNTAHDNWTPKSSDWIDSLARNSNVASNLTGKYMALWYSNGSIEVIDKDGRVWRSWTASSLPI